MTKVTISPTGQITIPAEITDQLRLKAGDEVSVDVQGDVLILHLPRSVVQDVRVSGPVQDIRDWRTMQGMFRDGSDLVKALEEEHRDELAREDARLR
jgi:AbrB family looped-hinge helix DNA binding protein